MRLTLPPHGLSTAGLWPRGRLQCVEAEASELELLAGCLTADPLFEPRPQCAQKQGQRRTGTGVGHGQAPSQPFLSCLELQGRL